MTSDMRVLATTFGMSSPVCIRDSTRASFFPSFPPGCRFAKSSSLKPRFSDRATASASPNASMVVVDAVGASPREQASLATEQSSATSAASASVESPDRVRRALPPGSPAQIASPVMLISGTCSRLIVASSRRISSVSPLADSASTTSPRTTIPRSPCTASTGCMNNAGVPIELSVAAILRAMIPLLPMPVTTTRPRQASINSMARSKLAAIGPAMRSASARRASASIRTTFSPVCFMRKSGCYQKRGVRKSEVVVDDSNLITQALRLNGAIPGPALPVILTGLGPQPWRQSEQEASSQSLAVGFIEGTQLGELLIGFFVLLQAHACSGEVFAQRVELVNRKAVLWVRIVDRIHHLRQVHGRMTSHGEGQLGLLLGDAINSREHQRRHIEHGGQRAQPRLIAMLRAEEAEHRVGNVTRQQIRRPALPGSKNVVEHQRIGTAPEPGQQFTGRRWRASAGIEQGNLQLARRKRRINHRQVPHDHAQEREAHARFHHRQHAGQARDWRDVAVAQGKERLAAVVEQNAERDGFVAQAHVLTDAELQERETKDEPNGPEHQQQDQR